MNPFYAAQAAIPSETVTRKKLKHTAGKTNVPYTIKKIKALHALQKNTGKLHAFKAQLTQLIHAIPDTILLKDRQGRKLITNKLTKHLFKEHDLDWYGKTTITSRSTNQEIRAHARKLLGSELDLVLEKRQLKLYYQVQVDGARQIRGAEALLRWEHPRYGLINSNQFISIAEQSGLILPIGAWVLQTACEQLKLWESDPLNKDLSLAVNISPHQFNRPGFVDQLSQVLKKTGINAIRLKLELTESLMLHDIANTIKKIEALKLLGIQFSMDNFGRGYSSLSHLRALPIDQLKIDRFLIRDITADSCDAMIIKAIIDLAHKLGIDIIAEGVETEQQFICLKQLGCVGYQGYLFGKPMPLEEFERLISRAAS